MRVQARTLTAAERAQLPGAATDRTRVLVRWPGTGKELDPDGEDVPKTAYWMRRLRDGDIFVAKPTRSRRASSKAGGDDTTSSPQE